MSGTAINSFPFTVPRVGLKKDLSAHSRIAPLPLSPSLSLLPAHHVKRV